MRQKNNNCPACADKSETHTNGPSLMGEPLPHNPNVLVAPYTPPTAQELELTRTFYAGMEARNKSSEPALPIHEAVRHAESRAYADTYRDDTKLPGTSGFMVSSGPPSMPRPTSEPVRDTTLSQAIQRAATGEDMLLASQLTAPWIESSTEITLQQVPAGTAVPDLDDLFPNDTPKDEVKNETDYAAGEGKYRPQGKISREDEPHSIATLPCNESKHYFDFDISETIVLNPEFWYWADARVRGAIVKYPAVPAQPGPTGWPAVPEQIIEERPPASDPDVEREVQDRITEYEKTSFSAVGHYADGALPTGVLDHFARTALVNYHKCESTPTEPCVSEFRVLRRTMNVLSEVGKDKPPKWRRGRDASDYEWTTDPDGRQVASRHKIYVTFKVTVFVSAHYWVVLICKPR